MSNGTNGFLKSVGPFFDAYRSFELRLLAHYRNNYWVNLVTQIVLKFEKPGERPWENKQQFTSELVFISGRWPISEFKKVLGRIEDGAFTVADCDIQYGRADHGKLQQLKRGFVFRTDSPEQSCRAYGINRRLFTLQARDDSFQNLIQDMDLLDLALNGLTVPYTNIFDLIHEKFHLAIKSGPLESSRVDVIAVPPVSFGSGTVIRDSSLYVNIDVASGVVMNDVTIGIITRQAGAPTDRVTYRLDQLDLHLEQMSTEHWSFSMTIQDASKVDLFLKYKSDVADEKSLENPRLAPSLLSIHEQMDASGEILGRFLRGEGNVKSRDFELAVAFLFSVCGFACLPYSQMQIGNQEIRPDGIAVVPNSQTAIVYECTISLSTQGNKLAKLLERTTTLQLAVREFEFIPTLVVPLPLDMISASTRSEAKRDRICILTAEDLTEFLDRCRKCARADEILAYIRSRL